MTCTVAATIAFKLAKNHGFFKFASKLYKLFLTVASTVVKNERSFSLMKMVKSYTRNKISGERLNDCIVLTAEKEITDAVNLAAIAKTWSTLKNRRLAIALSNS